MVKERKGRKKEGTEVYSDRCSRACKSKISISMRESKEKREGRKGNRAINIKMKF